jgi:hypothetical protein
VDSANEICPIALGAPKLERPRGNNPTSLYDQFTPGPILTIHNNMNLAHLLRSSKQRYMQFSPVLTTVGARTCTTWRFVYVLTARLRCWLYPHIQFCLNFYNSAGFHCKISIITTGWDCFGCQVTATLRAMRRLIGWGGNGLGLSLLWTGTLCSTVSFNCPGYE